MRTLLLFALAGMLHLGAEELYATFDVEAQRSAELTLTTTGVVETLHVDVGDTVQKGDVLLELDNDDLESGIALAEANLKAAEVKHRYAKQAYERYVKVRDVIDDDRFEQYAREFESSAAALASARASLANAKSMYAKSILRAPFSGTVSGRSVEVGDGVSGAMLKTLLTLVDTSKVKLVFSFDEKYWKRVKKGDRVTYTVDGVEGRFEGKIEKVYPVADPATRRMNAELSTTALMPGLFGEAIIEVE